MFEAVKHEAKYLRAGAALDEDFIKFATDWMMRKLNVNEFVGDALATHLVESYLDELYSRIPR